MKDQTPIERFETELRHTYDNKLKNDHILKAFKVLSNQMVLEALERVKNKAQIEADFINDDDSIEDRYSRSAFRNIVEFIETEVKPKYEN